MLQTFNVPTDVLLAIQNMSLNAGLNPANPTGFPTSQNVQLMQLGKGSYDYDKSYQKIRVTVLSGTFSVNTGSGDVSYPISTAGGEKIETYEAEAGAFRTLSDFNIQVDSGSSVLVWYRQIY